MAISKRKQIIAGIFGFIITEWKSIRICVVFAVLMTALIWGTFWAMVKTQEIRDRERVGGRYVGLAAITEIQKGVE